MESNTEVPSQKAKNMDISYGGFVVILTKLRYAQGFAYDCKCIIWYRILKQCTLYMRKRSSITYDIWKVEIIEYSNSERPMYCFFYEMERDIEIEMINDRDPFAKIHQQKIGYG